MKKKQQPKADTQQPLQTQESTPKHSPEPDALPFRSFLIKGQGNKKYLLAALVGIVAQFIVFKILYPFPDFYTDSYTYINVALNHWEVSFRPLGYSQALAFVHSINSSATFLVFVQYLLLQLAGLLLFFSVRFFFNLQKAPAVILFVFLLFNPVSIYISNFVLSDAFFISLSLLWFTLLLWIVHRPSWYHVVLQAVLLILIFKLRYTALYYPVIAALAFLLCRRNLLFKLSGIALGILLIFIEVRNTKDTNERVTGTSVFSGFSGWQMANNALHIYPYIKVDTTDFPSPEFKDINWFVARHFDTAGAAIRRNPPVLTTDYMWGARDKTPLKQYMFYYAQKAQFTKYLDAWVGVSPIYNDYGTYLIRKYPSAFAKYFIWPNVKAYFMPDLEIPQTYNNGKDSVNEEVQNWFDWTNTHVTSVSKDLQGKILQPFPYLSTIINFVFLAAIGWLLAVRKKLKVNPMLIKTLLLVLAFGTINFAFSVSASPIVFRYLLLPMYIFITFLVVILPLLINRYFTFKSILPASSPVTS
jgi:hypothetical protein